MEPILGMQPLLALGIGMFMVLLGILLVDRQPPTRVIYIAVDGTYDNRSSGWMPLLVVVGLILLLLYSMG